MNPQMHLMRVVAKPAEDTATVIEYAGEGTVAMKGDGGGHDYVCSKCGATVLNDINEGQVRGIVFRCNGCSSYLAV